MSVLTLRNGAFVPGTTQNIITTGSSQVLNAVGANTSIIRVACTADTFVQIGTSPVATTQSMMISGGATEFLAVVPGQTKVAVLEVTTAGVVSVTELTGY